MEKKTWDEFLQTELLWWINRSLHLFGWVIVVEKDTETKEVVSVYPAKTSYRGFSREDEEKGFIGLTKYLEDEQIFNILAKNVNADKNSLQKQIDGLGEAVDSLNRKISKMKPGDITQKC